MSPTQTRQASGANSPQGLPSPNAPARAGAEGSAPRFLQGLLTGVLLGGVLSAGLVIWIGRPQPPAISVQPPPLPLAVSAATAMPTATPAPMMVYVSGAVAAPGLYTIAADGRVADALEVAGGLGIDADGNALNLAQRLTDGARVHVPAQGEAVPVAEIVQPDSASRSLTIDLLAAPINLNLATWEELLALPGVGEKTAAAIEAARPFASVDGLDDVPGIGPATLEKLRPFVIAP